MLKSVMKEIVIILLLSIAILLILMVLFYDYIPLSKVMPERETYVTPSEVQQELAEDIAKNNAVPITYSVTDADLNIYKQSGTTVEGKANPFAPAQTTSDDNNTTGNTTTGGSTTNTNTNSNTTYNPDAETSSGESFYPETGTK